MSEGNYPESAHGWSSDFQRFHETPALYIRERLVDFLSIVSPEQLAAWDLTIPPLQAEVGQVVDRDPGSARYSAILEYRLPMEERRPDLVLLMGGGVLVVELKSRADIALADIDQASAYARDLRAYHRECESTLVTPALLLMGAAGRLGNRAGVELLGPDALDGLISELDEPSASPISRASFLDPDAYRPLPTIVEAARELMETGELRRVRRAAAATEPAMAYLTALAHEAAQTGTRHLVLLSGLPGTGKTLVGLQLVHSRFLDDLAVEREDGKPTSPAVYLSGNGPLVEVLQYELRGAGGGGKTFVRSVKPYVAKYSASTLAVPPEHVLIFDEAQRAYDAAQVAAKQGAQGGGKSEPEHFVDFAQRIPGWCVVVALIGSGQEIHIGEEGGIGQWRSAIENSGAADSWTVHAPEPLADQFIGLPAVRTSSALRLDTELRYHLASDVHVFVDDVLSDGDPSSMALAQDLERNGYQVRMTRDLGAAKGYLRHRYEEDPDARFGIVASSRDASLNAFGIPNDFQATKQVQVGPWFGEGDDDPRGRSCRALRTCVTEFGCQGLELDATLLAWGTDFVRADGNWTNRNAKRYQNPALIQDPLQLRRNSYRVLMTRARDVVVLFIPLLAALDETYRYLADCGFRELQSEDT